MKRCVAVFTFLCGVRITGHLNTLTTIWVSRRILQMFRVVRIVALPLWQAINPTHFTESEFAACDLSQVRERLVVNRDNHMSNRDLTCDNYQVYDLTMTFRRFCQG
jgi:hypothetical protein